MSDVMRPIPFAQVMDWVLTEHDTQASIFGVRKAYVHEGGAESIFAEKIETPFGPAAGPNTQLAQNIIASYVAGSRFFELKTVQVMDGEELGALRLREQALHRGRGRVLQLRVVHRAHGARRLCGVRQGLVGLQAHRP